MKMEKGLFSAAPSDVTENRIAHGKFILNGATYTLAKETTGENHLHGGLNRL